ncbi:hypothetical protein WSS15_11650 [Acetobacter pasteurianus]|nr:hypothetical protein WSS15_11650 [Acetobacter pasteurianus]
MERSRRVPTVKDVLMPKSVAFDILWRGERRMRHWGVDIGTVS